MIEMANFNCSCIFFGELDARSLMVFVLDLYGVRAATAEEEGLETKEKSRF